MNSPDPQKPRLAPSNSTTASALGGALAAITMAVLGHFNITFPAGIEASLAVVFCTLCGYIPPSGRQ